MAAMLLIFAVSVLVGAVLAAWHGRALVMAVCMVLFGVGLSLAVALSQAWTLAGFGAGFAVSCAGTQFGYLGIVAARAAQRHAAEGKRRCPAADERMAQQGHERED